MINPDRHRELCGEEHMKPRYFFCNAEDDDSEASTEKALEKVANYVIG